jgi:hypothetical protein
VSATIELFTKKKYKILFGQKQNISEKKLNNKLLVNIEKYVTGSCTVFQDAFFTQKLNSSVIIAKPLFGS